MPTIIIENLPLSVLRKRQLAAENAFAQTVQSDAPNLIQAPGTGSVILPTAVPDPIRVFSKLRCMMISLEEPGGAIVEFGRTLTRRDCLRVSARAAENVVRLKKNPTVASIFA